MKMITVLLCLLSVAFADDNITVLEVKGHAEQSLSPSYIKINVGFEFSSKQSREAFSQCEITANELIAALKKINKDINITMTDITLQKPSKMYGADNPITDIHISKIGLVIIFDQLDMVHNIYTTCVAAKPAEIKSPSYHITNQDSILNVLRRSAFEDAKSKAKIMAESYGLKIVNMITIQDDNNVKYITREALDDRIYRHSSSSRGYGAGLSIEQKLNIESMMKSQTVNLDKDVTALFQVEPID